SAARRSHRLGALDQHPALRSRSHELHRRMVRGEPFLFPSLRLPAGPALSAGVAAAMALRLLSVDDSCVRRNPHQEGAAQGSLCTEVPGMNRPMRVYGLNVFEVYLCTLLNALGWIAIAVGVAGVFWRWLLPSDWLALGIATAFVGLVLLLAAGGIRQNR